MTTAVKNALDDICHAFQKKPDGTYEMEIYADYRDVMSGSDAAEILCCANPNDALYEKLLEWYDETEWQEKKDLLKQVVARISDNAGPFLDGLSDSQKAEVEAIIDELVYWKYPEDHFLKQEFNVTLMLNTGDGKYDYTLNSPYPHWAGDYDRRLDEESSLLWLARQQGYTKTQLWRALREGDMRDPKGFLESCRVEVANLSSHMATVTFLVKMTLEQLIRLNRCIKLQDRNGHFYDTTKNPYCGYIVLDKKTMCGLYDPWNGGGSVLEIKLEKDVRIPIRFIRSALPDGCDGRSVENVYGMCGYAWADTLKKIHEPCNIDEMERLAATTA